MSKTFKKGDTVRCLHHCGEQFTKDKLYTVREDYGGDAWSLVKVEKDDAGQPNGWIVSHFELAEPEVSRGCLVTVRGGAPSWHTPVFYEHRSNASAQAKQLAEKYVGTEFAVYEQVTSFVADKPTAREV